MIHKNVSRDDPGRARGFIVVAVLWILAALATFALIYLSYVTNTAFVVAGGSERVQNEALVAAALELTAFRLDSFTDDARPGSGAFEARIGAAKVAVTFRSEAARIDLNAAPGELLANLMTGLGAASSDAAGYADRILAWRAPAQAGEDDAEDFLYRASGASYLPRHGPFPHVDELWLVRGIPPRVVGQILPFVTVFSGRAPVNILDAAPQVVAALPGMTPEKLQAVLSERSGPAQNPPSLTGITRGEGASSGGSAAYRVSIGVEPDGGAGSMAEIVIMLLESGDQPYRVLSWRAGLDSGPTWQKGLPR